MLNPIRVLRLADRPYYNSVSGDGRRFVTCARSGKCCLYDYDLRELDKIDLKNGVQWVQLSQTGSLLVIGYFGHIEGYATAGNITHVFKLPVAGTVCECCCFFADDQELCVASWEWDREPKITAWDIKSSTMLDEGLLPDRGGANYTLMPHPEGEAMAAIAASGQSQEWMFWAHYAQGRLRVFNLPEIEGVSVPRFHPTGRELVSHHERLGLCRMRFPSGELIGSVQPDEVFPNNPHDPFSYDVHFLRDDHVLVWQCSLSLYDFDLATLRPVKAVLTGVEGMTFGKGDFFSEQSWQLAAGRLLTSDHHYDNQFKNRTDTLRLWDASELFGPSMSPDPAFPHTKALLANG